MTKKRSLLLVSLLLVFGLVAIAPTAFAQNTVWGASAANENFGGRAQGYAEASGQVDLAQQGTSGTVQSGVEFIIAYTTGSASSSTPNVSVESPGSVTLTCTGNGSSPWPAVASPNNCGTWFGTPYLSTTTVGSFARVPVGSGPVVHIPFITQTIFANAASGNGSTLAVTVRLNNYNSGLWPAGGSVQAVATFYSPSPNSGLTITPNPSFAGTVELVNPDPAFTIGFGVWCGRGAESEEGCSNISQTAYVLLCLGVTDQPTYAKYFTLNVKENFAHAWTTESYEDFEDPGSSAPDTVTNGTQISVVLNNIPTNFGVSTWVGVPCYDVTATSSLYCPGGNLSITTSGSDHYWNPNPGNTGSVIFEYEATSIDAGSPENANISFVIYSKGPITTSALPCITAVAYKQPWGTSTTVNSPPNGYYTYMAYPPPGLPGIPFFNPTAAENAPLAVVCFNNCETNLLFPFILNYGPWDSDIAISNTTLDPLAYLGANPPAGYTVDQALINGSATPQTGPCALFFFSGGTGYPFTLAGALGSGYLTAPIGYGSTWTADLGAAGAIPGLKIGYVWAKCYFSQAYGYAEIIYDFGLAQALDSNYLAITIPSPQWSPRDQDGDGMGENATTPINITRWLAKEISGLYGSGHH